MHRRRTKAAANTIKQATGTANLSRYERADKRAEVATLVDRRVQRHVDANCTATTCRQRKLNNLAAKLRELHKQLGHANK